MVALSVSVVLAAQAYDESEEDLALNRRPPTDGQSSGLDMELIPSKSEKVMLKERFIGGDSTLA